jgi:hypothetical protein
LKFDERYTELTIQAIEDACREGKQIIYPDPVNANAEFPLCKTFYPLGFPVHIATNSQEVLDAAAQSWSLYPKLFEVRPIQIRVGVTEGSSTAYPLNSITRVNQHILSNIADAENYSISDIATGFSSVWLTKATVSHTDYLRYSFLDSTMLCQIATLHATGIHAACIERDGVGILLCGDSGAGKSTLSYACARAGWTYVTDDASYLVQDRKDRMVVGNCNQVRFRPSATDFFPEIEGRKITQRNDLGKPSIELFTAPFDYLKRAHCSHIRYIVFLNRRVTTEHELVPYSKEVAEHFMRQSLFGVPERKIHQLRAIDKLLEADILELRYQNLDWAIERLERLVEEDR